jgi:hypothetical protein
MKKSANMGVGDWEEELKVGRYPWVERWQVGKLAS